MDRSKKPPFFKKKKKDTDDNDEQGNSKQDNFKQDSSDDSEEGDDNGKKNPFSKSESEGGLAKPNGPSIGKSFHLRTTVHPKAGDGETSGGGRRVDQLHDRAKVAPPHPAVHKFHETAKAVTNANHGDDLSVVAAIVLKKWLGADVVPGGSYASRF